MKGGPPMGDNDNVQDQDLVTDEVTQALSDNQSDNKQPDDGKIPTITNTPAPAEPEEPEIKIPGIPNGAIDNPEANSPTPASQETAQPAESSATPAPSTPVISNSNGDSEELMNVKQQALEQLSPLVTHLDLPPDQKFDTYMEILRASDDKSIVKPAFSVAQEIKDEDKRAQALLDIVNEVNYLTQTHKQ